jgi:hypothetical protein
VFGLAVGFLIVLLKPWGAFVFSRTWLAMRGHQPWRWMRFLEDARRRGGAACCAKPAGCTSSATLDCKTTYSTRQGTPHSTGHRFALNTLASKDRLLWE